MENRTSRAAKHVSKRKRYIKTAPKKRRKNTYSETVSEDKNPFGKKRTARTGYRGYKVRRKNLHYAGVINNTPELTTVATGNYTPVSKVKIDPSISQHQCNQNEISEMELITTVSNIKKRLQEKGINF